LPARQLVQLVVNQEQEALDSLRIAVRALQNPGQIETAIKHGQGEDKVLDDTTKPGFRP
jgi:hypothetical protein